MCSIIFAFQYWVDPNAGDPKDAILVHCDMTSAAAATCIQPKPDMSDVTTVEGRMIQWTSIQTFCFISS